VNAHLQLGHITVDSPLYYSIEELHQAIKAGNIATADFGKQKLATYGKFDQPLIRLNSLLNDNRYDFMMKPVKRNSSESLTDLMQDLVGLGNPKASVTVIDLSTVSYDVVPMVAAQIGRLAYEFNFWNPRCTFPDLRGGARVYPSRGHRAFSGSAALHGANFQKRTEIRRGSLCRQPAAARRIRDSTGPVQFLYLSAHLQSG
jgi:hypothetical protein